MAIVPVPESCVNCGAGGGSDTCVCDVVLQEVLCDDGTDPGTPFLRIYRYSPAGVFISAVNRELDGTTPYVLIGDAVVCAMPTEIVGTVCIDDCGGSITVDDGGLSLTVDGTVELGAATLAALETVTVLQGTSPWVVSGTVCIDDCGGSITVDGTVTVLQGTSPWVVSGAIATTVDFDYPEDSPHVSGDIGAFVLAVRNDAAAVLTSTNGDYSPIAVDSAGRVGISDLGDSITVDGTVTVLQGTSPWVVSGTVELGAATLAALETITVLQGTSPWVVSGTVTADVTFDYAEDSPHVSGDIGAFVLGVRNDAAATLTSANGDYSPFATDLAGRIGIADLGGSVSVDDNGGSLTVDGTVTVLQGTSPWVVSGTVISDVAFDYAEDSVHVSGDIGAFTLGVRNDANAVLTSASGDYSPFSVTSTGALNIADAGGSITVDGTVELGAATLAALETITVLQGTSPWVVSGTVTSDVAYDYAEDSAHTSGEVGAFVLAVRNDANAVLTSANLDYSPFSVTSSGALNIADAGGSITVDGTVSATQGTSPWVVSGTVAVTQSTSPWVVQAGAERAEDSAHASGQIGNFVLAVRNDAGTSLVDATLDYAPLQVDSSGALRVAGTVTAGGTARDDTDDQAVVATGAALSVSRNYLFDGTNWDRQRTASPTADPGNVGTPTTALVISDGTNLRRAFSPPAITDGNGGTGALAVGPTLFNGTTYDRIRSGGVTGMTGVAGAEAHDAPVTGNPVLIGIRGSLAAPASTSADGDVGRLWGTRNGALRVYASRRRRTGLYYRSLGPSTVTAAADAATAGRFWLQNPVGSTIYLAVRAVYFSATTTTGLLEISAPVFTVERFTFTGTASGASLTPAKRETGDLTATGIVRTASTGMTITAGNPAHGFQVPAALATTSQNVTAQVWPSPGTDEDEWLIIQGGEGIVIRQSTAGTTLDTRVINVDLTWEEFNAADYVIRD